MEVEIYLVEYIVNSSFIAWEQQEIVRLSNVAYINSRGTEKDADFFIILLIGDGEKVIRIRLN